MDRDSQRLRLLRFGAVLGLSLGILAAASRRDARGELLYFAHGGSAQVPAAVEGDTVRVQTPWEEYLFSTSDFSRVVPGHDPEGEWADRRDRALKAGCEPRLAAAWWALENGLVPQAASMIRAASDADPRHPAAARLLKVLKTLDHPCAEPDARRLVAALPGPLRELRGPHVLLLHQGDEAEATERLDLLERVVTAFYLVFAGHGMTLEPPRERLVAVRLGNQGDYVDFLRRQNAGAFASTHGFYHPTFRAVIGFNLNEAATGGSRGESAPRRGLDPDPLGREQDRRRLLARLKARAMDDGTAAHEMVHLLVESSGLSPRHDSLPLWLHEGLACQFEVVRGGRWAGVGRANDLRLPDWRSMTGPPNLAGLVRDEGFGRGYRPELYARSWALVYFLRKARPEAFHDFLQVLGNPCPDGGRARSEVIAARFEDIFGTDLASLEEEWRQFLRNTRSPLEDQADSSPPGRGP